MSGADVDTLPDGAMTRPRKTREQPGPGGQGRWGEERREEGEGRGEERKGESESNGNGRVKGVVEDRESKGKGGRWKSKRGWEREEERVLVLGCPCDWWREKERDYTQYFLYRYR